uniref:50S ribosomal protein L22, chloroplastic n=1 Tax=Apostasia wallichii TaxID=280454 RepID=A0A2Z5TZM9_9ASPA|nr:50S ribosomal protein L22 [Apostasia wallichii]BBB03151.1 50S ribosomal protein L22 [Apostasia wallichii]
MILELMPYRASYLILKLVYSGAANVSQNMGLNETDLFISKAEVNGGSIVKKVKARAQGRSYLIKKHTCHIKIVFKLKEKKKIEKYGTKNKSTWFPTWNNPESSFFLVCTTKIFFHRSRRR